MRRIAMGKRKRERQSSRRPPAQKRQVTGEQVVQRRFVALADSGEQGECRLPLRIRLGHGWAILAPFFPVCSALIMSEFSLTKGICGGSMKAIGRFVDVRLLP
jgi:hypothetical protein